MEKIKSKAFGGERPLFASNNLYLENVTIHAGESALKECKNIEAVNCLFEGKYPFWHNLSIQPDFRLQISSRIMMSDAGK